jgi:type I restriction enzyme M protein
MRSAWARRSGVWVGVWWDGSAAKTENFDRPTIEALEAKISEIQGELAEAVEAGQEVAAYEPEEDETVTAAVIKKALKELIDDLAGSSGESAKKELKSLQAQEKAITSFEKRIKESKAELKTVADELEHKIQLKRLGGEEFKAESQQLLKLVDAQLAGLNEANKEEKKKITALQKDKATLEARLAKTDAVLASIGGKLTEEESKTLILKKLHDVANDELNRYLNAEKRRLIQVVENFWDKYAVSSRILESGRTETLSTLHGLPRRCRRTWRSWSWRIVGLVIKSCIGFWSKSWNLTIS